MRTVDEPNMNVAERRPWERPSLTAIGTVAEILKGGNEKVTLERSDTGDVRKSRGLT